LWIFSGKRSSCEEEIRYNRPAALAVNGNDFPLPLYAVYIEHVGLHMSPLLGNGAKSNCEGHDILCEQESKLMKTLLHRHGRFTSAVWIIIVLISLVLQASRDIYSNTLQIFKLFLCITYKLKIYGYWMKGLKYKKRR